MLDISCMQVVSTTWGSMNACSLPGATAGSSLSASFLTEHVSMTDSLPWENPVLHEPHRKMTKMPLVKVCSPTSSITASGEHIYTWWNRGWAKLRTWAEALVPARPVSRRLLILWREGTQVSGLLRSYFISGTVTVIAWFSICYYNSHGNLFSIASVCSMIAGITRFRESQFLG